MEEKEINGKMVYIFENHAEAIIPWAKISNLEGDLPYLITLDYHSDTQPAFNRTARKKYSGDKDRCRIESYQMELIGRINKQDEGSLRSVWPLLNHDEHIDAAIKSGIISHSFSIQLDSMKGTLSKEEIPYCADFAQNHLQKKPYPKPPYTYSRPVNGMFVVPHECAIGCTKQTHDNGCTKKHADQVIEDVYLQEQINSIDCMSTTSGLGKINHRPYILDVDLDYFRTKKAIEPETTKVFYHLINDAAAITIAKECDCVKTCRLSGETITCEQLLHDLLEHIKKATR